MSEPRTTCRECGEPLWGWQERSGTCGYCLAKTITEDEWLATEDGPPETVESEDEDAEGSEETSP